MTESNEQYYGWDFHPTQFPSPMILGTHGSLDHDINYQSISSDPLLWVLLQTLNQSSDWSERIEANDLTSQNMRLCTTAHLQIPKSLGQPHHQKYLRLYSHLYLEERLRDYLRHRNSFEVEQVSHRDAAKLKNPHQLPTSRKSEGSKTATLKSPTVTVAK